MSDLDFNIGLGYKKIDYDRYKLKNNEKIKKETELVSKFVGATNLGISLIWKS